MGEVEKSGWKLGVGSVSTCKLGMTGMIFFWEGGGLHIFFLNSFIYIYHTKCCDRFFFCRWGWSKTPKFDPGQRDQHLQLGGNHVVNEVPGELMEPGHIELPVLGSNHRDPLSSPLFLFALFIVLFIALSRSLSLYTPWHGGDGTKPPPKPLWIAEYTDCETISMRMITVRRRTAFGHGDQYHRDAMGPSSLFSVKTIPG